jgi:Protein of unknown function (DUF3277)
MASSTYSFLDVAAGIKGPGIDLNLGAGAGVSEEGITVESPEDINTPVWGADGQGMHSLSANKGCTLTISYLKTSPINRALQFAFNQQTQSAATHGRNTVTIRDVARGDVITLTDVAFKKQPTITYKKGAEMMVWTFDAIKSDVVLGSGSPEV